ncbi:thiamine phosphate synthase [Gelidibacter salicanalis]|uniref:Thiamine phosphate synthase n=1 Tax=Gelidibacter salicanalis TaxID=291193 RepID=A0A5C7AG78_9FLAO|nr:thiamine phosphate synthase [Gelidibacter salicanalis]TXE07770.1 thiamine phosphate synthase [Gelidibacter salicanalis]
MSTIPKLHYISQGATPEAHLENIKEACIAGVALVELRLLDVDDATLLHTATQAREITGMYQTRLVITDAYAIAKTVKADGVFLSNVKTSPRSARENLHSWQSIGAVAHTLNDMKALINFQVDYIALGPFGKANETSTLTSKDLDTLLQAVHTDIPFFAFGTVAIEDIQNFIDIGIYGIAVGDLLTEDFKKVPMLQKLLGGSSTQEQAWNADDWV